MSAPDNSELFQNLLRYTCVSVYEYIHYFDKKINTDDPIEIIISFSSSYKVCISLGSDGYSIMLSDVPRTSEVNMEVHGAIKLIDASNVDPWREIIRRKLTGVALYSDLRGSGSKPIGLQLIFGQVPLFLTNYDDGLIVSKEQIYENKGNMRKLFEIR